MEIQLKSDEKIEDLQYNGLQLIQSKNEYRFTTDAVLLANFCREMQGQTCVELGAGSGVISLLVAAKKHPRQILAVEIQPQLCDMMQRSVQMNGLQDVITVVQGDIKIVESLIEKPVDAVVCNPPYRKLGSGERQLAPNLAICRHEIAVTLAQVVAAASKLLKNKGAFYLVHQPSRLCEIVTLCASSGLAVKEILPVCPRLGKEPSTVLVRAMKSGESDCILHAPVFISDENGQTDVVTQWFSKGVFPFKQ